MTVDSSARILIVDDDDAVRKVLGALLEQSGMVCSEAASGEAACAALEHRAFDLVLTDLRMPGKDGLCLLSEIVERWPGTPVVVLTAHGTVPLAVQAMRAGAADFILKPFDREQLLEVTRAALEKRRGGAEVDLSAHRRSAEREALAEALRRAKGNRTAAARLLGVSRRTLHYKLKDLGVS